MPADTKKPETKAPASAVPVKPPAAPVKPPAAPAPAKAPAVAPAAKPPSAPASASASGSGSLAVPPPKPAPASPLKATKATAGVKPATISTSVSVSSGLIDAFSDVAMQFRADEKAAVQKRNADSVAVLKKSRRHPAEKMANRPVFVLNTKCDVYDPKNPKTNTFRAEYVVIKTGVAHHLRLIRHEPHNDKYAPSHGKLEEDLVADVLLPPCVPRIVCVEPCGTWKHELEGKKDADLKSMYTGDVTKSNNVLAFDGHPFMKEFADPDDPTHRDIYFVKTLKHLAKLHKWAVAWVLEDDSIPIEDDPTAGVTASKFRIALLEAANAYVVKPRKGAKPEDIAKAEEKTKANVKEAVDARRKRAVDAHETAAKYHELNSKDAKGPVPREYTKEALDEEHPLNLTDEQWAKRIRIDDAYDAVVEGKKIKPAFSNSLDKQKAQIPNTELIFMSSARVVTLTAKAKETQNKFAKQAYGKRKTTVYTRKSNGKGKGKGKAAKAVSEEIIVGGDAKEFKEKRVKYERQYLDAARTRETDRSMFESRVHDFDPVNNPKTIIPLRFKRIIARVDKDDEEKTLLDQVTMSAAEVEELVTSNSVLQPKVRLEFKMDHAMNMFGFGIQPRDIAFMMPAENARPVMNNSTYFVGDGEVDDYDREVYTVYTKEVRSHRATYGGGGSGGAPALQRVPDGTAAPEPTPGATGEETDDGAPPQDDSPTSKRLKTNSGGAVAMEVTAPADSASQTVAVES